MRFKVDITADERALHEVYLPHFRRVADEGVASVMSAYNSLNGEWCGQNHTLLTEILRRGIDVMEQAWDDAAATTAGADPFTRLAAHVRAHLAALFDHGPYTAAHVTAFRTAPVEVRDAVVPMRDAYEARWTELLSTRPWLYKRMQALELFARSEPFAELGGPVSDGPLLSREELDRQTLAIVKVS